MKQTGWYIVFALILIGELVGIQTQNITLQYICKPMIVPVVMGFLLTALKCQIAGKAKWIIAALIFSWMGDILLLFESADAQFFIFGLAAFLMAHIYYIVFFHRIRMAENIKSNPWLLVIVVLYYAALMHWLSPYLYDMKWPVRVYGIVISFMFMLAMHMSWLRQSIAGRWMVMGALLFVISDSVLAINKFYQSFSFAGIIIITTYAVAQFCIVKGAVLYFLSTKKE